MATTPAETDAVWTLRLPDEAATQALARSIAAMLRAGDFLTLSGDLGAGKTTFARAMLRDLSSDPALEVPSPTFTLLQTYDTDRFPVVHADLYRIGGIDELAELGWDEAAEGALVVLEWPDRLAGHLPLDRLDIAFRLVVEQGDEGRDAVLTGYGAFVPRLAQARAIAALIAATPFKDAARTFMFGDASTRAYERLKISDGRSAVLMISPPRTDAAVARFGKPYHHVARLAGDIRPFLAMDRALQAEGVSVPQLYAVDAPAGLAVMEDLGSAPVIVDGAPVPDRWLEAIDLLARLHDRRLPDTVPGEAGEPYAIPAYDLDAYLIEAELVIDWYAPHIGRMTLPASARASFVAICTRLFDGILTGPKTWCLRDYHSPNLIWLADRAGPARIGVIDFQDCVIGHPAYDVASLLQDARVTVPDGLELKLLGAYAQQRRGVNAFFDMASFAEAYAVLGVQRATKILGGFARLDKRDGKPHYLPHIPRIEGYLAKGLAHPALAELRAWYRAYLPRLVKDSGASR